MPLSSALNYAPALQQSLSAAQLRLLHSIAAQAARQNLPIYMVGGFVRDLLLQRPSQDFDIVVEGDAIPLANALVQTLGGNLTAHSRFGTAQWQPHATDQNHIDLITARRETYAHPAALPTVQKSDIQQDLARRDFSINTLALRLDEAHFGDLLDPFNGQADLQNGLVRVLHPLSFTDDPTRILRAIRYEQRYGFQLEENTLRQLQETRSRLSLLSAERLRHELDLILREAAAPAALQRLHNLSVLEEICAALPWNPTLHAEMESALTQPPLPGWNLNPAPEELGYALWLLRLPRERIDEIQTRLRLPLDTYQSLCAASALRPQLPALQGKPTSDWVLRLQNQPLTALYALQLLNPIPELQEYAQHWRHIRPRANGDTLKARGIPPGKRYQTLLWALRAAWLDGKIRNEEEEERWLEGLVISEK